MHLHISRHPTLTPALKSCLLSFPTYPPEPYDLLYTGVDVFAEVVKGALRCGRKADSQVSRDVIGCRHKRGISYLHSWKKRFMLLVRVCVVRLDGCEIRV